MDFIISQVLHFLSLFFIYIFFLLLLLLQQRKQPNES
jgi:hypothetical protein